MASDTSISRSLERYRRLTAAAATAPLSVLLGGFLVGAGAAACLAAHLYLAALALFLINRASIVATLSVGDVARVRRALAAIALAAMPFGFALADMTHAMAASFLLVGLLAETAVAHTGDDGSNRLFGLAAALALAIACIRPDWFGVVAYTVGVSGFVAAGFCLGTSFKDAAS